MSLYDDMLPKERKDGRIGYYPVINKEEWEVLPALYKAMDWNAIPDPFDKNKRLRAVKSVIFDVVYMEPYCIRAEVSVHPENIQKILFCSHNTGYQCHLHTISGVELEGGTRLNAKWMQDSTTGSFGIFVNGNCIARQGGFGGYIPDGITKDETGAFKYDRNNTHEGKGVISHYNYSNPFIFMGATKKEVSSIQKLIEAMADYAQDACWNDSDFIEALIDCGLDKSDFEKYGYGDFVKTYYEDDASVPKKQEYDVSTKKWFLEVVQDFDGTYYANLTIDSKEVKGLPEHVDYNTLKEAIKNKTGISILNRNDMKFQQHDRKKYAYIDTTQPREDCRVTLDEINAGWTPKFDVSWICVYKDALGYQDDNDNLTNICVPTEWLEEVLKAEGENDINSWFTEYTADNTDSIARYAKECGVILDCDDKNINIFPPKKESLEQKISSAVLKSTSFEKGVRSFHVLDI